MSEPSGSPAPDWRATRREERRERREARWGGGGPWVGGLVLIAIGVVFLLKNYGFPFPKNWWGVFLFIPALAALGAAWNSYRKEGALTSRATGAAVGGIVLAVLGISFLLGFDWGQLWPVILIALGIGVVVGGLRRR
ncbi:hypothetical protein BH10PSE9_BH10PSE9_22630 [soil metagenome]